MHYTAGMPDQRSPASLSRAELRRYARPLLVPEWEKAGAQEKLKHSSVLVIGAGGLGGAVIAPLAGAGVGQLTIADGDTVSLSNLHRQTLFSSADVGRLKAEVACARAQGINPFVQVRAEAEFTPQNAAALVAQAELVVDATDNFQTRYLIADACQAAGKNWVWGAAGGTTGMVSVFTPQFGLRQLFPDPAQAESCDAIGVLGPVPNLVGQMMACEVLKVLGGVGESLVGRLWTFEALTGQVRVIRLAVPPSFN